MVLYAISKDETCSSAYAKRFFTTTRPIALRAPKHFFGEEWSKSEACLKNNFDGEWDPARAGAWVAKSRGEIRVAWEGDSTRKTCSIKQLLEADVQIVPYVVYDDSSEEEEEDRKKACKDFGHIYTKKSNDKTQPFKEIDWELIDHSKVKVDVRTTCTDGGDLNTEFGAKLINVQGEVNDVYSIWKHLTPPSWIPKFTASINKTLQDDPIDRLQRKTSEPEVEALFGLALAAAVSGQTPFEANFAVSPPSKTSLFQGAAFGQYGIPKNRALILLRAAHLSPGPEQPEGADCHWFIDPILKEYNRHMNESFRPSWLTTGDESGCVWHGATGEGNFDKCPHTVWNPKKPEPLAAEFNDCGCAKSGVLTYVEFEKAAKYHKELKYMDLCGTYNAAMSMRMCEAFANRNRLWYGDARFISVKFCYHNMATHGNHSAGDLKGGSALFPKAELKMLCGKEHGALVVLRAQVPCERAPGGILTLYAIAQRRGPAVHTFISTCGTFKPEVPTRYSKISDVNEAPWTTASILNVTTEAQGMIDKFNRSAFDQLGLHDTFIVRSFEQRFSHHFAMPLPYISAINFAKYNLPQKYPKVTTAKTMLNELAAHMVKNPAWLALLQAEQSIPRMRSGSSAGINRGWVRRNGGPPSRESPCKHTLIPLAQLEGYKGNKQQRCHECNELASWCCQRCSTAKEWVALHPSIAQGSKRRYGCLNAHRNDPYGGGYKATHEKCSGTARSSKRRRRIDIEIVDA